MDNESMMALSKQLEVEFDSLVENCLVSGAIDLNLYQEYDVKRGLRDSSGKGVLTGLTEISDVTGYDIVNGVKEPADGKLFYQGYDVKCVCREPCLRFYSRTGCAIRRFILSRYRDLPFMPGLCST